MNSGCKCKGICERYDLKKRPDYAKGDVFCRVCERSFSKQFNAQLRLVNPDYKYCFCCHARVAEKARTKPTDYQKEKDRHDYMKTFAELGIDTMQQAMIKARKQKEKERESRKIYDDPKDKYREYYIRNRELCLQRDALARAKGLRKGH